MLEITFNNLTGNKNYQKRFFTKILKSALTEAGLADKLIGLSLNLVGKAKIQSLNRRYRKKNRPTDVLSFPLEARWDKISESYPRSAIIEAGDIFICPSMAAKAGQDDRTTLNSKLASLTIHGFLHLLGYDHEKSVQDKKIMFGLQNKILKKCVNI